MDSIWPQIPFILPQASSIASTHDTVFAGITLIALIFAIIVCVAVTTFAVRYRRGSKVDRTLPAHEGIALELTWTMIPLFISMGLFVWSTSVYFQMIRPPADAMEVYVVGKQWMWKLQHQTGRWEMNELHIPKGRAIKLTMISEDVIHDFAIPAFRIRQDVIPGRYTQMWFQPTQTGRFHIFCSQFCGTNHAIMGGYVTVMEPEEFDKWMNTGNLNPSLASRGERLFRDLGCTGCHGPNAAVRAPSLNGIYNQPVAIENAQGQTSVVKADFRYIHDSIILPEKEIAAGYKPIMPSYKGKVKEEDILHLIEYIRSLDTSNGTSNGSAQAYDPTGTMIMAPGGRRNKLATGSDGGAGKQPTANMANVRDRNEVLFSNDTTRAGGKGGDSRSGPRSGGSVAVSRSNPTGSMSNVYDREGAFKGDPTNSALIDNAGGSMVNEPGRRDRLGVYRSNAYTDSYSRAVSGMPAGRKSNQPAPKTPKTGPRGQAAERKAATRAGQ